MEDLKLDKMGDNEDRGTDGLNEIIQIKQDFFLKDSFCTKYPKELQFSFCRGPIHVTLDIFHISDSLTPFIKEVRHTPCSVSDYYYVDLTFNEFHDNKRQFGPGYWKCNVSILSDPGLYKEIENEYQAKFRLQFIKDGEWWDQYKITFRMIISYSRKISNHIKQEIKRLEAALWQFIILANSDEDYFGIYITQIKQELNDLIIQKLNESIIRSRVQFVENYENPLVFSYALKNDRLKIVP